MARVEIAELQLEQLARTAQYDCQTMARLCNLSLRQLEREFRRRFDCSPHEWLNVLRIRIACERLLAGEPVKKIALDLGYKQSSHFCRQFKERTKFTPSEFITAGVSNPECRSQITNVARG